MNEKLNYIICPGCGWTGTPLLVLAGKDGQCPECNYENFNGPLLTLDEMLNNRVLYNNVRLDLFLKSVFKHLEMEL